MRDGLPIDAGRLPGHVGDPVGGEPIGQAEQFVGRRAEASGVLDDLALDDEQDTGQDRDLRHVEAGAAGMQEVHRGAPGWDRRRAGRDLGAWSRLLWVLPASAGATGSGPTWLS